MRIVASHDIVAPTRSMLTPILEDCSMRLPLLFFLLLLTGCDWDFGTGPSGRGSRFVSVAPGVSLEYIDHGGSGPPIVFLAGLGNTAHVYDGFAERFTDRHRVIAVTRRGFGRSSRPPAGYDLETLTNDLLAVLDRLRLDRVDLVGHSVAGDEMTRFAGSFPNRVRRLVYLDAAIDRIDLAELIPYAPIPPLPVRAESLSVDGYRGYLDRVYGVRWPTSEVLATTRFAADGRLIGPTTPGAISAAIIGALVRPAYAAVQSPSLGIYPVARTVPDIAAWLQPGAPDWDDAQEYLTLGWQPFTAEQRARFRAEVAGATVLEIDGGNHFLFLSQPDRVADAIARFLDAGA